ncbi:MAG TPA: hypothetical protein VEB39_04350 [Sphingomicrobium sp.]|nr:hypothetical protein [Sphingomicrobium sp.]
MEESQSVFRHYSEELRLLIWSGFFDRMDFQTYLDDLSCDEDAASYLDELREYGKAEFDNKNAAESDWPERTDWDRLNDVFEALNHTGILALHNAGYTTSDAHSDAWEIINDSPPNRWLGFCFYHGQDVERAVLAMPLFIGFDAVADDIQAKREIGDQIANALRKAGFTVDWNGDPETRMSITNLDWKKRTESSTEEPPSEMEDEDPKTVDAPAKPGFLARLFGRSA